MNIFSKNKSTNMSLPQSKTVHGIEIKKVPVCKYIEAIGEIEQLPGVFVDKLFPNETMDVALSQLGSITAKSLLTLFLRALIASPDIVAPLLEKILDVDKGALLGTLTLKELKDVIKEYWAINDMTDFFGDVLELIKGKLPALITGFSGGSPSPNQQASAKKPS